MILVLELTIARLQEFEAFVSGMISCFFLKASHCASGMHHPPLSIFNSLRFRSFFAGSSLARDRPNLLAIPSSQSLLQRRSPPWSAQLRKSRSFNMLKEIVNLANHDLAPTI